MASFKFPSRLMFQATTTRSIVLQAPREVHRCVESQWKGQLSLGSLKVLRMAKEDSPRSADVSHG